MDLLYDLGKGRVLKLDEILPLGLKVLVFDEDIRDIESVAYHSRDMKKRGEATFIDAKWLDTDLINPDNSLMKQAVKEAEQQKRQFNLIEQISEWSKIDNEYKKRKKEYSDFRPTRMLRRIKNADLIIVPDSVVEKIKDSFPDVYVAVLKRNEATNSNLLTIATDSNKTKRIDRQTINLLFNQQARHRSFEDYMDEFMYDSSHQSIDPIFYNFISNGERYVNTAERTTKIVKHGERKGRRGRDLYPMDTVVSENFYGMGGKQHNRYFFAGNNFLNDFRADKYKQVKKMYEALWVKPLGSIDEILERQEILGTLIDDAEQREAIGGLAKSLNRMFEPYIHLSNMSKLLSTNLLHSKWGAYINKNSFLTDFVNIGKSFIEEYEQVIENLNKVKPINSKEFEFLLRPLNLFTGEDSDVNSTYVFIKSIVESEPKQFSDITKVFENELKRLDAKKIKELEEYDPRKDKKAPVSEGKKGNVGTRGCKSDYLIGILDKFHKQNPVTRVDSNIAYLDYVGTRLSAYSAMAEFIQNNGWTRPQIMPTHEGVIDIKNGWYPLTLLQHTDKPVRNSTNLDSQTRIEIIDGPNVGGKTIDVKKTLFIVSLALAGTYVPAEEAKISFFDNIVFRLKGTGMDDNSALLQDLNNSYEALSVLDNSCLIGLDETYTSTNYKEGEALTYGLIRKISESPKARAILTSHYPTLHDILDDPAINGLKFSHFEFKKGNHKLLFPHKKMEGPNQTKDYAIPIAENENVSPLIIKLAESYQQSRG